MAYPCSKRAGVHRRSVFRTTLIYRRYRTRLSSCHPRANHQAAKYRSCLQPLQRVKPAYKMPLTQKWNDLAARSDGMKNGTILVFGTVVCRMFGRARFDLISNGVSPGEAVQGQLRSHKSAQSLPAALRGFVRSQVNGSTDSWFVAHALIGKAYRPLRSIFNASSSSASRLDCSAAPFVRGFFVGGRSGWLSSSDADGRSNSGSTYPSSSE